MTTPRFALALAFGLGLLGLAASAPAQQPRKPSPKPAAQETKDPVREGLETLEARLAGRRRHGEMRPWFNEGPTVA